MRRLLLLLLICLSPACALADAPKCEMRAVWLTTNWGLDWPSFPARNEREAVRQREELARLLDEVASLGFNTVFFQARIRGEVFYASAVEPWSGIVSGRAGRSPGYDPLAYAVEECHRRGMECHAWLVSIPAGSSKQAQKQGSRSVVARHPELCKKLKGNWYLDPGHPGTATYLASLAKEIASRYEVDGIHLDYIRYPEEEGRFPDGDTYARYAPKGVSLREWRFENISRIVSAVGRSVKEANDRILVSTAPLGRYTSILGYRTAQWSCMGGVSQDAIAWLQQGDNDFIVPMMYYAGENYYPYLTDWVRRAADSGYVVAGLGAYRLEKSEGNWPLREIEAQIQASRAYGSGGQAFFRLRQLLRFPGLAHLLAGHYYRYPALLPPVRKGQCAALPAVSGVTLRCGVLADTLMWSGETGALRYAVYASVADSVDTGNPVCLLYPWVTDTVVVFPAQTYNSFAVTAIDRCRMESRAAVCSRPKAKHRHRDREDYLRR